MLRDPSEVMVAFRPGVGRLSAKYYIYYNKSANYVWCELGPKMPKNANGLCESSLMFFSEVLDRSFIFNF